MFSNWIHSGLKERKCQTWNKQTQIIQPQHEKNNKMSVRPAKTQISLGIRPVWSESSLCAQWAAKDPSFLHADSEDSDQTGRMHRLIRLCWAHTHFVGFVVHRLISLLSVRLKITLPVLFINREQARGQLGRSSLPSGTNFSLFSAEGEVKMYRLYGHN